MASSNVLEGLLPFVGPNIARLLVGLGYWRTIEKRADDERGQVEKKDRGSRSSPAPLFDFSIRVMNNHAESNLSRPSGSTFSHINAR